MLIVALWLGPRIRPLALLATNLEIARLTTRGLVRSLLVWHAVVQHVAWPITPTRSMMVSAITPAAATKLVAGGVFDGDGEAAPVGVEVGAADGGVGDRDPQCLLVGVSLPGRRAGGKMGAGCPPTPVFAWDVSPLASLAPGP